MLARWEKLQSGEIDAGLQGAPLNYIAADAGLSQARRPAGGLPGLPVHLAPRASALGAGEPGLVIRFMRAFLRAHDWFYVNREGAGAIAVRETGVERHYADRAWDEYVSAEIFPRDADANDAAVQALIDISALIRALPHRTKTRAADYINRTYLEEARSDLDRAA
jgi:ABC-type nitrate/sulfonate/bicarbonate transport system substrate-binding protein